MATLGVRWGGILSTRETRERLRGWKNVTRAYIQTGVSSKRVKRQFYVTHPFNMSITMLETFVLRNVWGPENNKLHSNKYGCRKWVNHTAVDTKTTLNHKKEKKMMNNIPSRQRGHSFHSHRGLHTSFPHSSTCDSHMHTTKGSVCCPLLLLRGQWKFPL